MMSAPRKPRSTLNFVDQYCAMYQDLFADVRSFNHFKWLHVGLISEIPRKSLPAIAKAVGLPNGQALHHFLSDSPWNVEAFRQRRLAIVNTALRGRPFTLCIDETGVSDTFRFADKLETTYRWRVARECLPPQASRDYRGLELRAFNLPRARGAASGS